MTGTATCFEVPQVTLKSSYPCNAKVIEFNVSKMTFPDVPEKNELANIVVWGLAKSAGTRYRAATVVEPITSETPIRII
jgi:hypothetical protein